MNNTALAEDSNRLAKQSSIRRASARARRDMDVVDAEARRELKRIYRGAVARLSRDVEAFAAADGNVRLEVLQRLLQQANGGLKKLEDLRDGVLSNGLNAGATVGTQPFIAESAALSASLTNLAQDAVRAARSFIAEDGLQLSDRIWRNDRHARRVVKEAIEQAVIQGHSASQAAREFLARGEAVPGDVLNKLNAAQANKIISDIKQGLINAAGSPMDNALRLFRTEINRAHGLAYQNTAFSHPDVVGTRFLLSPSHPRPDICDMHSKVNRYGLGAGVYPKGKSPWPAHPNTLSYEETVFIDQISSEDQAGKETRIDWLEKQTAVIQRHVLNGRNKQNALSKGWLKENQIKTPWNILKKNYQRKGLLSND
ncbi:MAG: hypothetical protein COB22_05880 [Cycloclasticus sp.]|nr:MAG: hypothetical protein COB22_05880 [Cycloclasticus sp.]